MPNWWNRDKTNFSTNKLFIPKAFLFSSKQDQEGYSFLKKNNYDNQKIVCLILRDGAYHKFFGDPKKDYSYHNYRNVDIGSYILSIKYLLKKNYFVVRMGSVNEKKLNFKNKNYLEYSEIKNKNDFLDFWIISKSFMCITTGTGVDEIGAVYQVPTLDSNFFPCGVIRSGQRNCLTIFKKIMKKKNQELVNLSEMISMDFCGKETFKGFSFYQKNEFKNNFKLLDNSPKEILDALIELELRTLNQYDESSANLKNQELFWNIYKSSGIYDKFIKELNTKSTIGKKYLEENNWLLM